MSEFNPETIITRAFDRLRRDGFNISISEYIAALDAVKGGIGATGLDELKLVLQLLWCHSLAEQARFEMVWQSIAVDSLAKKPSASNKPKMPPTPIERPTPPSELPPLPKPEPLPLEQTDSNLAPLPIQSPFLPSETENLPELQTYYPMSRRSMVYLWRYLRRPVADGPADVLDVAATVDQAARQGFFLAPAYRRREINRARLLLLIDQDGSMTPFHRFTRDLVETAQCESTLAEGQVNVFYFHNVPADYVYQDDHLTLPVLLEQALADCDGDTSVLIVSDAGAARGYRRMERVGATTEFLVQLKQRSSLISWLNPMPAERWNGTSAELISYLVSMEQMDGEGLNHAIDVVRGQPLSHLTN
jgi:uncharacterized protein